MPSQDKEKKVTLSFSNWILGGSLVTVSSTENGRTHTRRERVVLLSEKVDPDKVEDSSGRENQKDKGKGKGKGKDKDNEAKSSDEKKKNESTGKKDYKKDDKNNKKDANEDNTSDSKFTKDQDAKIKDMKADNKSWNEIAITIGSTKNAVRERFKELTNAAEKTGSTEAVNDEGNNNNNANSDTYNPHFAWCDLYDEMLLTMKNNGTNWVDIAQMFNVSINEVQSRIKTLSKGKKSNGPSDSGAGFNSGSAGGSPANENGMDFGDLFANDNWGGGGDGGGGGSGWQGNTPNQENTNVGEGNGGGKDKKKSRGKGNPQANKASNNFGTNQRANNPSQSNNNNEPKFQTFHGQQGGGGRLKPDNIWSQDDLEILEILEARYVEHKWLRIQADFYNYTGRMIVADVIEQKFRADGLI